MSSFDIFKSYDFSWTILEPNYFIFKLFIYSFSSKNFFPWVLPFSFDLVSFFPLDNQEETF